MSRWRLTVDCASPPVLAAFWSAALHYEPAPPPDGFADWEQWLVAGCVPEEEWDDGAYLSDAAGASPSLSFLRVPERKTVKNRLHIDVDASGGRHQPLEMRWPLIRAEVERLAALGAAAVDAAWSAAPTDHVVMTDPEGNEFCVV